VQDFSILGVIKTINNNFIENLLSPWLLIETYLNLINYYSLSIYSYSKTIKAISKNISQPKNTLHKKYHLKYNHQKPTTIPKNIIHHKLHSKAHQNLSNHPKKIILHLSLPLLKSIPKNQIQISLSTHHKLTNNSKTLQSFYHQKRARFLSFVVC
jgi:hypothetical protein